MSVDTQQDCMTSYLSAVAAELDRRGVAASTVGSPDPDRRTLSGTLTLGSAGARPGALGWGPVSATWDEDAGWSVELSGIHGVTGYRFLHLALVPAPEEVAGFICGLASGQDLGMTFPVRFRYRDDDSAAAAMTVALANVTGSPPTRDAATGRTVGWGVPDRHARNGVATPAQL